MPKKVDECVKSVLEDNPSYSEERAWAICSAQFEADVEEPEEIHALADTTLMANGLDELADRRPNEWTRVESEAYGVAWIGQQSGHTVFQAAEDGRPGGHEYPEAGGEDAPPEVQEAVERFREEVPEDVKVDTPLLYWLLGDSTPVYKMAMADADYQDESNEEESCANCEYAYQGVDGSWICSQIAGEIEPEAWCRLWEGVEAPEGQSLVQQAVTVDAIALEFGPGGEVIDHDEGDWGAFLDDLSAHGDVFQVWKGIQRHPEDDLESHDHATYVALDDGGVTDVEEVLADHPAVHYTINAGTVGEFDRPDDWDPEANEFYHGAGGVEEQTVTVQGLSQEAITAIRERYNATVFPGR